MSQQINALRVVDHPELGRLELLSQEVYRSDCLPAETRSSEAYLALEKPIVGKLQSLALPDARGRMSLTRALLRDRFRIVVCCQHWRWSNPDAKGRKDRWREAWCVQYASARTAKRQCAPAFATQSLWTRPDVQMAWSGEPDQPQPPAEPCFLRIVTGDDLWPLLADIRFKTGTEALARRLVHRLADSFNRQAFDRRLFRLQPPGTRSGFALVNGIRAKLARHYPKPGPVFIAGPTLHRWLRDWAYAWNLGIELPQLSQFVERLNESLPPDRWIRTPQELRQLLDAHGLGAGWKLLSRHGSGVLRPFDQASDRRSENFRELLGAIVVQTRMGNAELFPPWFLRDYIRLREEAGAPPLGELGWPHLPGALFSEAGRRARQAKAATTRLKLIREVSLLLACPDGQALEDAHQSGGWQAALRVAKEQSMRLANAQEIQGLRFVPLIDRAEFKAEGAALNHCMGDYHFEKRQRDRGYHYVSVRLPTGARLASATLRYYPDDGWQIREAHGANNSKPDAHLASAIQAYSLQLAPPQRNPLPPPTTTVDLVALGRVLPRSGLRPETMALIRYLDHEDCIELVEPPAGGLPTPYVDPHRFLSQLSSYCRFYGGLAPDFAKVEGWIAELPATGRVVLLSDWVDDHIRLVPALPLFRELQAQDRGNPLLWDYLLKVIQAVEREVIVPSAGAPRTLEQWQQTPDPLSLSEFQPGSVWFEHDDDQEGSWQYWRERIRPVLARLERELGQEVGYLADSGRAFDDDCFHRNLVLHSCCELAPDSPYVRFLVEVSRAGDAETLQRALIDPASFADPFMLGGFCGGARFNILRFRYPGLSPVEGV